MSLLRIKSFVDSYKKIKSEYNTMSNSVLDAILARRSVREYTGRKIENEKLGAILEAGRWGPSGMNNQPWKFIVVREKGALKGLAKQTHYSSIIEGADLCIAVFLDHGESYDRTKDLLAMGASCQNMLLAAHSLGLGAVWLGQILANKDEVSKLLNAPENLELVAVLALGYPVEKERRSERKDTAEMAFAEKFGNRLEI